MTDEQPNGDRTPVPKACPDCGQTGGLTIGTRLVARPLGTWSLAGAQMKTSARTMAELACSRCGMSRVGRIEGNHFVQEAP